MDFKPIGNRTDSSFYQEETAVRFCQCDFSHRLKLSELFRLFSDLAVSAFAFRGMDTRFLLEHQMVFLISRMAVGIRRMPLEGETLRLSTWEQEAQRAQFLRNFQVWSGTGELLCEARSGWAMVNPFTRAIMRPQAFMDALPGRLLPMPEEDCGATGAGIFRASASMPLAPFPRRYLSSKERNASQLVGISVSETSTSCA